MKKHFYESSTPLPGSLEMVVTQYIRKYYKRMELALIGN